MAVTIGVVMLAAGGAAFYAQHQANRALRGEIAGLREEIRVTAAGARANSAGAPRASEAPGLASQKAPAPTVGAEELAKLREEIAAFRKSTQALTEFAQLAQAAAALKSLGGTETTVETKLTPSEALKNAGRLTPEAATETVLWAAYGGDVDALANSFVFTPTAREKADTWFAGLPANLRQQYGSPEKVIALMIAKDAAGLTGMQVLGQKEIAPDNVGVRVRFASADGKTKDDNLLMRRVADGWRMVVPDNAVEKFARQLAGKR
jgi:hypothetical protein